MNPNTMIGIKPKTKFYWYVCLLTMILALLFWAAQYILKNIYINQAEAIFVMYSMPILLISVLTFLVSPVYLFFAGIWKFVKLFSWSYGNGFNKFDLMQMGGILIVTYLAYHYVYIAVVGGLILTKFI